MRTGCLITILALVLLAALGLVANYCGLDVSDTTPRPDSEGVTRPAVTGDVHTPWPPSVDAPSGDVAELIAVLATLQVAQRASAIDYDRDDWRHWVDADRDCQNTRAEVLIAESLAAVSFAPNADNEKCRVTGGQWRGPWSGELFTDAGDVDIDHHVPMGHAHESGGWIWDKARKRAYANDLDHPASLQATSKLVNRTKGKQPPDQWRPEKSAGWCRYAADWIAVKAKWQLTVTDREVNALRDMLNTCDDADSWGLSGTPAS